mmetsp:Transcript_9030/g.20730  ORF Transcript_9030/g.20730 Transcript_9030/m.20730 type:complete len:245 (+) Transcript_9030:377-1111(+)
MGAAGISAQRAYFAEWDCSPGLLGRVGSLAASNKEIRIRPLRVGAQHLGNTLFPHTLRDNALELTFHFVILLRPSSCSQLLLHQGKNLLFPRSFAHTDDDALHRIVRLYKTANEPCCLNRVGTTVNSDNKFGACLEIRDWPGVLDDGNRAFCQACDSIRHGSVLINLVPASAEAANEQDIGKYFLLSVRQNRIPGPNRAPIGLVRKSDAAGNEGSGTGDIITSSRFNDLCIKLIRDMIGCSMRW